MIWAVVNSACVTNIEINKSLNPLMKLIHESGILSNISKRGDTSYIRNIHNKYHWFWCKHYSFSTASKICNLSNIINVTFVITMSSLLRQIHSNLWCKLSLFIINSEGAITWWCKVLWCTLIVNVQHNTLHLIWRTCQENNEAAMLNILVPCPVLTQDQPIECRAIVTKLGSVIYIFNLRVLA